MVLHEGEETALRDYLVTLPIAGSYELSYRNKTQGRRTAKLEVRFGDVSMPTPRQKSPWLRELGIELITMNVVEVREVGGLGGHLLRKCDGEPGWITIWRGFKKLHLTLRATRAYRKKVGNGQVGEPGCVLQ